ncbi:MAG: hypothetical protein LBP62_03210 [Clostridiales bacterium]|jgi:hypothetical protein|nr:hypothetical protein [Clostridiales bacterium]
MKKIIYLILVLCSAFGAVNFGGLDFGAISRAEVVTNLEFDDTDIMTDLNSATINGKAFDIADYPYVDVSASGKHANPQFLTFVEYAYTFKKSLQGNFGMYLYIYNPSGREINFLTYFNNIKMATAFSETWEATEYGKFDLFYCDRSKGEIANLFYKFRVLDRPGTDGKTVLERVNPVKRIYDIAEIELVYPGDTNATAYKVGGRYVFSGYAKGYGVSVYDDSTLSVEYSEFDTIELEVRDTFYRTPSSDKGKGYKYQLNSVYFAVDNRYIDDYGILSRILAEAYEYETKNMVVTESSVVYDKFIEYIGERFNEYNPDIGRSLYLNFYDPIAVAMSNSWDWALNPKMIYDFSDYDYSLYYIERVLYYLFRVNDIRDDVVSGETLREWVLDYDKSYESGTLPIKDGTISADLFQPGGGKVVFDIDTTDKFNMLVYNEGWFNKFIDYGLVAFFDWFGKKQLDFGTDVKDITPFYEIQASDFSGTDAEIAQRLLIAKQDVQALKDYYNAEKLISPDKRVYLFRYSVTDYYAEDLLIYHHPDTIGFDEYWDNQAYLARETVYFDFDIIQLTFSRDGKDTVIPAVSAPIDIFADVESPLYAEDLNYYWLVIVVLAVIIIGSIVVLVWIK